MGGRIYTLLLAVKEFKELSNSVVYAWRCCENMHLMSLAWFWCMLTKLQAVCIVIVLATDIVTKFEGRQYNGAS
jgi:hypothetical protein